MASDVKSLIYKNIKQNKSKRQNTMSFIFTNNRINYNYASLYV